MEIGSIWQLILLIVLLILSSYFSASETALMSLSKIRIRNMIDENIKNADLVYKLTQNPSKLLSAILIANNGLNIGASALATSLSIKYFGEKGVGIATAIMTVLILIFGEITPKTIAANNSEGVSLKVSKTMSYVTIILNPITKVFNYVTDIVLKILKIKRSKKHPFITEEELKTMVDVSHEEGVLEVEEKHMIHNVFEFGDMQVVDIMTPRTEIIALNIDSNYEKTLNIFKIEKYSRIIIYEENIDNIVGILHIKDFVLHEKEKEFLISDYMRQPFYTYEYKNIAQLFGEMRNNKTSIAIVLDEYGGTAGIVTSSDLVEEIVGDIADEYYDPNEEITVIKEDEFIVDGSTKIDFVNEMIGTNIESEDFDSIGGFVVGELGGLPSNGEVLQYGSVKFIVEKVERNRIVKLRIIT